MAMSCCTTTPQERAPNRTDGVAMHTFLTVIGGHLQAVLLIIALVAFTESLAMVGSVG